jgi:hypothetical protein
MDVKNFSKFDRLAKKIISTTKRNIFFLPKTTRMQHNFLQNVRRIIAISFDKSNGTFVRLGRCSRLILKYVFCFLLDMDDGCEIFVETCSYIGQCVVKLFMDDKKFFNEETLFNGQMLLENITFI